MAHHETAKQQDTVKKDPVKRRENPDAETKTKKTQAKHVKEDDHAYTYEDYLWEAYNDQYNDHYNDRYIMEDREQAKQANKKSTFIKEEEEYTREDYLCEIYNDQYIREDREQSRARYGIDRRSRYK